MSGAAVHYRVTHTTTYAYEELVSICHNEMRLEPRSAPRLAETPYQNRFGEQKLRALEEFGGTPESEHAVAAGLAYLARIQGEISRVGKQALGTGSLPEIRKRLRADKKMFFTTREEIEAAAKQALDRAQAAEPRFLGKLPRTPCTVLMSTGKKTPRPMTASFIASPRPRNRISGGSSAALGSGRSTSVSGSSRL